MVYTRSCASSTQRGPVGHLAGCLPFLGDLDELLERRPGVRDDAEIGEEDAAQLGGLDVHVDELTPLGEYVDGARHAVRPAIAYAQDEVAAQVVGVAVSVLRLQPDHAGVQRMVVGNRAPAHEGRHDWRLCNLCQLGQQLRTLRR